ncbi:MAG: hypothetical protein HY231_15555 [Acidobacteria bacterium]|nr:hypothetical protein [Acidobacteriota bacterium]
MKKYLSIFLLFLLTPALTSAKDGNWRTATDKELKEVLPTRAPVEKERIETEFRTAAGVTDGKGKFIAGILMITAGYAAEGKYSHFFLTQVPLTISHFTLPRGAYVFGSQRLDNETVEVKFYEAASGKLVGTVQALKDNRRGAIRSFWITPLEKGSFSMQVGRFRFVGKVAE